MDSIGIPEVFFLLIGGLFWLVPVVAAVWALVALHRVRTGQNDIRRRLEAIERLLQRST
jgi:hypothetical protein